MINTSERMIIGAWLTGDNTHHIENFDKFDYNNDLLQAIKKYGHEDPVQIAKETERTVLDIAELIHGYMPSMYEGSYKIVREAKIKRLTKMASKDDTNRGKWLELIQDELQMGTSGGVARPVDIAQEYRDDLERRKTEEVMPYGIADLDYYMGGLRRKEFTIIAGRPSMGKTALGLQLAHNLSAYRKRKVLFFSLEMSASQIVERLLCMETDIPHEKLKHPKRLTAEEEKIIDEYLKTSIVDELMLYNNRNLSEIEAIVKKEKPDVVFVDQLSQLREERYFNSFREQFTHMTTNLKAMSMEHDTSIVLMTQLRRDAQNREPTLADLKESGSIEEDSDNVIMIHQPEDVDRRVIVNVPKVLIIRKQRNGMKDVSCPVIYQCNKFTFRSQDKEVGVDGYYRI